MTVIRRVHAGAEAVFQTVADPRQFAQAIVGVTEVAFLSGVTSGVGTRFRQVRTMNGREMRMEFEVTEYVEHEHIRMVNETHGTVWDSSFTFASDGASTTLTMRMEARARRVVPRLMMPLIFLFIRKAVARDIDALKAWCERPEA